MLLLVALCLALGLCAFHICRLWGAALDDRSYVEDVRWLRDLFVRIKSGQNRTAEYYTKTTDRDYRILEWFFGPGMHTRLVGCPSQLDLLERHLGNCKTVLEVGSGRGCCTMHLATNAPGIAFHGVDLVQRHVQVSAVAAPENCTFFLADVADHSYEPQYDLIFGVESMCHIGDLAFTRSLLRPGGRLVIIDGFRGTGGVAMDMAEAGFRINDRMPTKDEWITLADPHGLRLIDNLDLTKNALPFWTLGWSVARIVARFLPLQFLPVHSAANLLAVCAVAQALRRKEAKYGMLVFVKSPVVFGT